MKSAYIFGTANVESDKSAPLTLLFIAICHSSVWPSKWRACFEAQNQQDSARAP